MHLLYMWCVMFLWPPALQLWRMLFLHCSMSLCVWMVDRLLCVWECSVCVCMYIRACVCQNCALMLESWWEGSSLMILHCAHLIDKAHCQWASQHNFQPCDTHSLTSSLPCVSWPQHSSTCVLTELHPLTFWCPDSLPSCVTWLHLLACSI